MWRPVVVTVAAAGEPVSLAGAKAHLRIDHNDDDAALADYIAAARAHIEGVTGTRLYTQTVTMKTDCWADLARLPTGPVQSITSITYTDTAGASATLAGTVYEARLDGLEPCVVLKFGQSWPPTQDGSLVTITAVVGYGVETSQPPAVMQAARLIIGDLDAFRESAQVGSVASQIPSAANVEALLSNHKIHLI